METRAERIARACREYDLEGRSLRQIAATIPESHETVRIWLTKAGIELKSRGQKWGWKKADHAALKRHVVAMSREGHIAKDIAEATGLSRQTVGTWSRAAGVSVIRSKMSLETRQEILRLYLEEHLSMADVAIRMKIGINTVLHWIHHAGIRGRRRGLSREERDVRRHAARHLES